MIKFYHGSDTDISEIQLSRCKKGKDFGQGFYLTKSVLKAERMAARVARINGTAPVVNIYKGPDFSENLPGNLSVKIFDEANEEWAEFVYNNRETDGFTHQYDIVVGPTADDDLRTQFIRYNKSEINFKEPAKLLKYKESDIQYCFCSAKSLKLLK